MTKKTGTFLLLTSLVLGVTAMVPGKSEPDTLADCVSIRAEVVEFEDSQRHLLMHVDNRADSNIRIVGLTWC